MAITGIGNNYNNMYESTYAAQKNETSKKADTKETASAQAGDTKKAGTDSVSDYYSYLQKNYDCVKNGSVAISGSYLKECAKNPGKAKELEENLSFFKEGYESGLKSARANARAIGARLVNYSESWSIDSTGNITMMASTTVTSDNGTKGVERTGGGTGRKSKREERKNGTGRKSKGEERRKTRAVG